MSEGTSRKLHRLPTIEKLYAADEKDVAFWLRELCVQLRAHNEILSDISHSLDFINRNMVAGWEKLRLEPGYQFNWPGQPIKIKEEKK